MVWIITLYACNIGVNSIWCRGYVMVWIITLYACNIGVNSIWCRGYVMVWIITLYACNIGVNSIWCRGYVMVWIITLYACNIGVNWPGLSKPGQYSVAFPFLRWGIFLPMGTDDFRKFLTSLIFFIFFLFYYPVTRLLSSVTYIYIQYLTLVIKR